MEYSQSELLKVIQEPLSGLILLKEELPAGSLLHFYTEVLAAYLSGDTSTLIRLSDESKNHNHALISVLVKTRLAVRESKVTENLVNQLNEVSKQFPDWRGESLMVAGFASETIGNFKEAKDLYYEAFKTLEEQGARIKGLKALHNYISAYSKVDPERAYFAEFHMIYRKGKAQRNYEVAGTALTNIAREFQKMKTYRSALKYACKAILFLQTTDGTYHHHMALLNRCHILCDLGRFQDAMEDFDTISKSSYAEVRAGLKALEEIITNAKLDPQYKIQAHPTWLERLAQGKNTDEPLSDLEDRVLALLAVKPRDKYSLIQDLYGEKIDLEAAENRLKNLLNRLRKKKPGAILFKDGLYSFADGEELLKVMRA
jgi:tetratricopeptide (TPR) repeat protein